MNAPKVSVLITAFNRAAFIEAAVRSALEQVTTFDFEVVVGEDCSTDGTREILQRIAREDPRLRLLLHARNLGMNPNFGETLKACGGEYVAILDGDDLWIDREKLQRSAKLLDAHPECAMSFHRADLINEHGASIPHPPVIREVKTKYSRHDLLERVFRPRTCTVVFRRAAAPELPAWIYHLGMNIYDLPFYAAIALHGEIGFVDRVMGAYRMHSGGLWSGGGEQADWKQQPPEGRRRAMLRLQEVVHVYEMMGRNLPAEDQPVIRRRVCEQSVWIVHIASSIQDWGTARRFAAKAFRADPRLTGSNRRLFARLALTSIVPGLRPLLRRLL